MSRNRKSNKWSNNIEEIDFPATPAELSSLDQQADDHPKLTYTQWATSDCKVFMPTGHTRKGLIPGVYDIHSSPQLGIYFQKIPVNTDNIIRFPDSASDMVLEEIKNFWEKEDVFKEFELLYKRGIMLYGPPGGGKSCTIQLIMKDVVQRGGVVIKFTSPSLYTEGMRMLREIELNLPVVTIMEDIDSIIQCYSESEVLNILDGVNQLNKIVYLATTNYPEMLGPRIINRPSRFDKRFRIGAPSAESRKVYFKHLINGRDLEIDLEKWVKDTEDMSIAHIRELFIAVIILGNSYDSALTLLKEMKEDIDEREYGKVGFHSVSNAVGKQRS